MSCSLISRYSSLTLSFENILLDSNTYSANCNFVALFFGLYFVVDIWESAEASIPELFWADAIKPEIPGADPLL